MGAIAGCHCWGAIGGVPLLGAIAGCHARVPLLLLLGAMQWVPLLGAIAVVPLSGAIAGFHCWVPLLGCHCWVPLWGAMAGCHCWCHCCVPLRETMARKIDQSATPFSAAFFSALITHQLACAIWGLCWYNFCVH